MKELALLSNITTGVLKTELSSRYQVYEPDGFDTWRSEMLDESSALLNREFDLELFLFFGDAWRDNWESTEEGIRFIEELENDFRIYLSRKKIGNIVVSTLDFPRAQLNDMFGKMNQILEWQMSWWNMLLRLQADYKNIYIYDWCRRIHAMGTSKFYSDKMWYAGSMPFSLQGIKKIADDTDMYMRGVLKERKKCVVLDLDNTLWGGVAGEGDILIDSHNQGKIFQDFQRQLKQAKEQGIILAILSKNNFDDVEGYLKNHPQMLLHLQDFAAYRIDWTEKYKNIRSLAKELNIGLDSMIFIDDNPAEREAMRQFCPEVTVPDFPGDVTSLSEWFLEIYRKYLFCVNITEEDAQKTEMYQQEQKRREVKEGSSSLLDYLAKLEIEIDMHRMRKDEISRVSQLCMKTNQFNLTTRRYSENEIRKMNCDSEYDIYSVHTKDKFGDNGLVSVVICRRRGKSVEIDTFLMSCRVMGRKIEEVILHELAKYYSQFCDCLIGTYIETAKNQPVKDLYKNMNFQTENERDYRLWLNKDIDIHAPSCFKKKDFQWRETDEI